MSSVFRPSIHTLNTHYQTLPLLPHPPTSLLSSATLPRKCCLPFPPLKFWPKTEISEIPSSDFGWNWNNLQYPAQILTETEKIGFWLKLRYWLGAMGNRFICMTKKDATSNGGRSKSKRMGSQRKLSADEELLHRQALSMAIHQHQLSQRFDGSMSRRTGVGSTSSRRRNNLSVSDPPLTPKQVLFSFFFMVY